LNRETIGTSLTLPSGADGTTERPKARGSVRGVEPVLHPAGASEAIHPELEPLAFLLGTWIGQGEGEWPGAEPFTYGEEMRFEHVGDPYLVYEERSWVPSSGDPIHLERGFLRPVGPGRVDLVLAHPLGVAEVSEGTVDGTTVELASTGVSLSASGSPVTELRRHLRVHENELIYRLDMATVGIPIRFHVRGRLVRA
jgi:hypothetical protein